MNLYQILHPMYDDDNVLEKLLKHHGLILLYFVHKNNY